jgi:hypothetical protein
MKTSVTMLSLMVLAAPACLLAQDKPAEEAPKVPDHFYKLNLTVEETSAEGRVINARTYVAMIETGNASQQIRTGSKVPITTGTDNEKTQVTYIDLGVNFDVHQVKEVGEKLSFSLQTDVSSLSPQATPSNVGAGDPVIRQNKWNSIVLIPLDKPTIVFSADDIDDKGKMQVELTATRLE